MTTRKTHSLTITRGVHAAVTIASDTTSVVIDPGFFGYPETVDGANAVLITHDHFDHVDLPSLAESLAKNPSLTVFSPTPLEVDGTALPTTVVAKGDRFSIGDIDVEVVGEVQATASLDDAPIPNVGYLVAGTILHPGDQRQDVEGVEVLFTALAAPWQNNPQLEEHLRRVKPRCVIGLHDATLSDMGRGFAQKTLENIAASYGGKALALNPGDAVTIDTTLSTTNYTD